MRPLGRCGRVLGGGTPSKDNPAYWNGEIPWVTAKEMWNHEVLDSKLKITELGLKASPTKLIPANSVLFVVRGSILFKRVPVAVNRVVCTINQDMKAIVPDDDILGDYLALMMKAANDELKALVGTAGNSAGKLETEKWSAVEIPIPPLTEQRRLVARIEALTDRLEQARQARLAAFSEAASVFQRMLANEFAGEVTEYWDKIPAERLFDMVSGQASPLDTRYSHLPYLGPEHVESGTGRIIGEQLSVAELSMKSGKYYFTPEHVVYSKIRPALRKVCLPDFAGLCSADMYALKPNLDNVTPEFLHYLLLAPAFSSYAVEQSDRNAMPKINRKALFGFRFRVPKKSEQKRIVRLLTSLQAKLTELQRLQAETETKLAAFTPALLAKAFRGEF
jgi:type I restriction enzyme S subunit